MIENAYMRRGVWVYRNLIKHQNAYWIYRINKVTDKKVFFDPRLDLSKYSTGYLGHCYVGNAYDLPRWAVKDKFRLFKKPSEDIKRAAVRACFNVRD
jgi:hypothetical protein